MPTPTESPRDSHEGAAAWVTIRFRVPRDWKRWLDEIAAKRATTVSEICRQLVRQLMLERPR